MTVIYPAKAMTDEAQVQMKMTSMKNKLKN